MTDTPTEKHNDVGVLPRVITVLLYTSMALLIISGANLFVTNSSKDQLHDTQAVLEKVDHNVDQLTKFVDDLQTETPAEKARNAQVTAVLILVPQIKEILCQHVGINSSDFCQSP